MLQLLAEKFTLVNWKTHQVRPSEVFERGMACNIPWHSLFFFAFLPTPLPSPSHLTIGPERERQRLMRAA
jgi:hypothetical protein